MKKICKCQRSNQRYSDISSEAQEPTVRGDFAVFIYSLQLLYCARTGKRKEIIFSLGLDNSFKEERRYKVPTVRPKTKQLASRNKANSWTN